MVSAVIVDGQGVPSCDLGEAVAHGVITGPLPLAYETENKPLIDLLKLSGTDTSVCVLTAGMFLAPFLR